MGTGKTYSTKYLLDSNNNSGVAGQVLSTTSTGINWVDSGTLSTGLWLSDGNDIYNSNSGNVGIGTTSPGATLELNSDTGNAAKLKIGRQNGATNYLELGTSGGSSVINAIGISGVNASLIFNRSTTTATTQSMIIDSAGNVGIGTTSPTLVSSNATTLEISGSVTTKTGALRLASSDNSLSSYFYHQSSGLSMGTATAQPVKIITNNSEKIRIESGGNVGIGTTSPGAKLDVRKNQAGYTYIASDNANTAASGTGSGFAMTEAGSIAWYLRSERDGSGKFNIGDSANRLTID